MSYKLIPTPNFSKKLKALAKKYPSMKEDLLILGAQLIENPTQGSEIYKNCYKVRFGIKSKGKGKRGGGRLITYVQVFENEIYLLSIFDKSEQDSISDNFIKQLIRDL